MKHFSSHRIQNQQKCSEFQGTVSINNKHKLVHSFPENRYIAATTYSLHITEFYQLKLIVLICKNTSHLCVSTGLIILLTSQSSTQNNPLFMPTRMAPVQAALGPYQLLLPSQSRAPHHRYSQQQVSPGTWDTMESTFLALHL